MADPDQPKKKPNLYAKFSSMAIQMAVIITLFALGGRKIDAYYQFEKPIWTVVLSLIGVGGSLYLFIRGAQKISQDD